MGGFTSRLSAARRLEFEAIPGFPAARVPGHAGTLVVGRLEGRPVLCQSGRFHAYEGYAAEQVALPVRVMANVGVTTLCLTNAAGGIDRRLEPGSLMLLTDHLNLSFRNPLIGVVAEGEIRFPDLSTTYHSGLWALARQVAAVRQIPLGEGVYAGVTGPSYETPAEIRMLAWSGAAAVGMSTVLEVIAARARGMRCLGISVITNRAAGLVAGRLDHSEVVAAGQAAESRLSGLLEGILTRA
jgi:purine-nucleoside phosphorylase